MKQDTPPDKHSAAAYQTHFTHEMGITHAEFMRTLPAAIGDHTYAVVDSCVEIQAGARRLKITLEDQRERVIASLRLPVTTVRFEFCGYSSDEVDHFMKHFMLYFQRGGG